MFKWLVKVGIVIVVTLTLLIGIKANSKIKNFIYDEVYTRNISFAVINKLYHQFFGKNILFDDYHKTEPVFNETLVYNAKTKDDKGLKLEVTDNYLVPNLESGLVIFTGTKDGYGNVVIIEQVDGIDVWYGNLSNINVKLYDYIDKGALIGTCDKTLYLVHKKDGELLDYEDKI